MSDLISRQAAVDSIETGAEYLRRVLDDTDVVRSDREKFAWGLGLVESSIADMKELPSEEPERKKGKWIDKSGGIEGAWNYCSVCGEQAIDLYDFCPNCGADMRGEQR